MTAETVSGQWPLELPCDSKEDLLRELAELAETGIHWIYRGQKCANWKLKPTLERRCQPRSIRRTESGILWDFKRHARSLSDRLPEYEDNPSWFSFMRHHGTPTRLLDWTESSYIAMFFACEGEEPPDNNQSRRAIWAVNATLLTEKFEEVAKKLLTPKLLEGINGEKIDLSEWRQFDQLALYAFDGEKPPDTGLIGVLLPRSCTFRMSFQQGTFLINCNHQKGFEDSLEAMMQYSASNPGQSSSGLQSREWIKKLTFPSGLREELLRFLYASNIHPFTLFPDLDGLGNLLKLKVDLDLYRARSG